MCNQAFTNDLVICPSSWMNSSSDAVIALYAEHLSAAIDAARLRPNLLLYPAVFPSGAMQLMVGDRNEVDADESLFLEPGQSFEEARTILIAVSSPP